MRAKIKQLSVLLFVFGLLMFGVACASDSEEGTDGEEAGEEATETEEAESEEVSEGGDLHVAVSAQPPILDPHLTTTSVALDVTANIFETLLAPDEDHNPTPVLAESVEVSDDQLTYTFKLREGVLFHNGEEMTSEDVEASMNRWLGESARAKNLLAGANFEATDEYEVVLTLEEVAADTLDIMAGRGQFPAIMPKDIIESATEEGVSEIIGTGPFKYEDWKQDQYILLSKFDDYQLIDEKPSGLTGKKEPLVDQVYYHIVTDSSTRVAGVQTGEYHIADDIPYDNYEQIKNDDSLETYVTFDNGTLNVSYNKKEGIMTDPVMRQAINAALDMDAIMLASFADEDLFITDPSYMNTEQVNWASDAGSESYNIKDPDKAKELLEEAGYDGEEITIMATRDYDYHYNAAVVLKEQIEQVGMNAELEIYDWPTLVEKREDPENWDLLIVGTGYVTTPSQLLVINPDYAGWTDDETIDELLVTIRQAESQEEAKAQWDEMQSYIWNEYVPFSLFGHYSRLVATTDNLEGFTSFLGPVLWNTSIKE